MIVTTVKASAENQDDWRKDAEKFTESAYYF